MELRREDASEEQREEERHRRGERAASPRDEAGAEEDRSGDPEQDRRRDGERLGEGPPEGEPDRARKDGAEDARPAHRRPSARERSHSPAAPASVPPIAYGTTASTSAVSLCSTSTGVSPAAFGPMSVTTPNSTPPNSTESAPASQPRRPAKKPAPSAANMTNAIAPIVVKLGTRYGMTWTAPAPMTASAKRTLYATVASAW